ncbi:MAG: hypothetical protein KDC83_02995 [Flavobacteriales bacterium]|nr:hypothetical protein [Flavobacteriales bacterium]
MRIAHVLSVLFSTLFSIGTYAQQSAKLNVYTDTAQILIGQQIEMTLELTSNSADEVALPILQDSLIGKIEILERSGIDTSFDPNNLTLRILHQKYILTSFDSGFYAIPPIPALANGDTIYADPFLISVYTYQIDSIQGITDIKAPIEMPLTFMDYVEAYWHYAIGILLAILLGLGIYLFIKSRKKAPEAPVVVKEIIPAHIIALQKLKELDSAKLWQSGQVKEYHVRLSEIVREYIENRYHILALEQTTAEILHHLRLTDISDQQKGTLRKFLMLSDLVKFAKEEPLADENTESIRIAFEFVEKTKELPNQVERKTEQS